MLALSSGVPGVKWPPAPASKSLWAATQPPGDDGRIHLKGIIWLRENQPAAYTPMKTEIWKNIPGYEGKYQVSDLGRVRSLDRSIEFPAYTLASGLRRCGSTRRFKGKILRPGPNSSGHVSVVLGHGLPGRLVHQLVMLVFIGRCPAGQEVLHLNHAPSDNRLENLKYGTRSENLKMDYARGINRLHGGRNRRKHEEAQHRY